MARLHADSVIRPSYVKEACRLLRTSNINIVKNDIEFEENQIEINEEVKEGRLQEASKPQQSMNDLFQMEEEAKAAANAKFGESVP